MNRYETNSKGTSPALSAILNQFASMPKSAFDETRRKTLDAAPYAIIPIECFLMFPNSKGYLRYNVNAISKNPFIRRLLSSMNIELRTYKCRCSDLWEGWNNFVTKGRSGKLDKKIPSILFEYNDGYSQDLTTSLPYNPYHYLNIAPPVYAKSNGATPTPGISQSFRDNQGMLYTSGLLPTGLVGGSFNLQASKTYNEGISALPGVMYCKIAKEYQNSNLLQENPYWYPENENHDLILPYSCDKVTNASYDHPTEKYGATVDSVRLTSIQPTNNKASLPWLNVLFYRQRKGNYFNTGSPFPDLLRGDVPTLDILGASADFTNAIVSSTQSDGSWLLGLNEQTKKLGVFANLEGLGSNETNDDGYIVKSGTSPEIKRSLYGYSELKDALNKNTINQINFSMKQWRRLATMTVFRERMARTDGSYNQMIEAQFAHNPKWHEHSVVYCGGHSQPIVFSEVVQTSEDGSSPLGTTGGRAVTSSSSNEIEVQADDYTIFMTVMTITPDDYLSQGIDRMWSELTQAEQYFPILNNLDPQAIKNKELFLTGTDSSDEDIFNYQELFAHFKSRQNQVSGLLSLPISKVGDTGAYILNRLFTSQPQFNNAFVTGQLTSNEQLVWASTEQAQFVFDIASQFKYVAPMPAVTQASTMGLSYA